MKYKPGTFVLVPNLPELGGKPSEMQVIYMWLCNYANKDGTCFPSRRTIAKESGCNIKTVDKYIQQLVDDGFIEKTNRGIDGSKQKLSNIYTMLLFEVGDTENGTTLTPKTVQGGSPENGAVTISNNNNTNITKVLQHGQLPIGRGSTYILRVLSIYRDLFRQKYGFEPQVNIGRFGKSLKELMQTKTELQVAALLIVFFNWQGMTGNDPQEAEKLLKATHNPSWFFSTVTTYEAYLRNVQGLLLDDELKVKEFVASYFARI